MSGPLGGRFPLTMLAHRNLTRARARTALATAGIVIGVVAIVSLGIFGSAFYRAQVGSFMDSLSSVDVSPGEEADFERLRDQQMARVETAAPEGTTVVGVKTREASVVYGGEEVRGRVKSVERPRTLLTATRGEIPRTWRSGAVVGATLARQEGIGVGDSLRIDGDLYRVRAVLESETNLLSPDYAVFVPPNRLGPGYDSALVRADDTETAFAAATRLDDRLNAGRDRYHVRDFESSVRRIRRQKAQIDTFLLGVGAISMFVAGVSILNVMLMSVMERRQEIGVLRAVGYHRFDVLRLVVGEAALLGVVGALLGAVVSLAVGLLIHDVMLGDPTAFTAASVRYLAIGVGFGLATSVVSGLYPAWKAANAHPVEALRE